jgi:hypothetical protein
MMHISYGWTSPAVKARRKTMTRRDWKDSHAKKFKPGDLFKMYDKDPRYKGKCFGVGRIVSLHKEPIADMPDSDYEAEGFAYLFQNLHLVPKSMPIDVSPEGFNAWRNNGATYYTVEFEIMELFQEEAV